MANYGALDMTWRLAICYCLIFALFILSVISFSVPFDSKLEIPFLIMTVYYWSVYRPTLISPFFVFLMGLSFDLLSEFPLGLTPCLLLFVRYIMVDQRLYLMGQPFMVIWLGYGIASFITLILQWGLFGLSQLSWVSFFPVFLNFIAGILCFPLVSVLLNLSHKVLPLMPDQYSAVR